MNYNSNTYKKCVGQNYQIWVGYTAKKIGRLENAEDLVQSVLAKVWSKIDSLKVATEEDLKRYIYRSIDNTVKNYYKKKANTPELVEVGGLYPLAVEPKAYQSLKSSQLPIVQKMIKDLELNIEEIELLSFMLEDYTNQEILEAKGLSNKSLESIKQKKKRLRVKLKRYYNALPLEVKKDYEKRRIKKKP